QVHHLTVEGGRPIADANDGAFAYGHARRFAADFHGDEDRVLGDHRMKGLFIEAAEQTAETGFLSPSEEDADVKVTLLGGETPEHFQHGSASAEVVACAAFHNAVAVTERRHIPHGQNGALGVLLGFDHDIAKAPVRTEFRGGNDPATNAGVVG